MAYGNGTFLAGSISYGEMKSSTDGKTWTVVENIRLGAATNPMPSIAYGGGKFVAAGDAGKTVYSADGVTWTLVADSKFSESIDYIVYDGSKFVAASNTGKIAHSNP
jgi:hypothetical protein